MEQQRFKVRHEKVEYNVQLMPIKANNVSHRNKKWKS